MKLLARGMGLQFPNITCNLLEDAACDIRTVRVGVIDDLRLPLNNTYIKDDE